MSESMSVCLHEEVELKKEFGFNFAEIHNSNGQCLYVIKLCKICHLLYWEMTKNDSAGLVVAEATSNELNRRGL